MSKHSPGPWRWVPPAGDWQLLVRECTQEEMLLRRTKNPAAAGDTTYPILATDDIEPGDAALIAAAPTMLAMLEELELDDGGKCPICYRNCSGMDKYVHASDCRLGTLLTELRK